MEKQHGNILAEHSRTAFVQQKAIKINNQIWNPQTTTKQMICLYESYDIDIWPSVCSRLRLHPLNRRQSHLPMLKLEAAWSEGRGSIIHKEVWMTKASRANKQTNKQNQTKQNKQNNNNRVVFPSNKSIYKCHWWWMFTCFVSVPNST